MGVGYFSIIGSIMTHSHANGFTHTHSHTHEAFRLLAVLELWNLLLPQFNPSSKRPVSATQINRQFIQHDKTKLEWWNIDGFVFVC